MHPDLSDPRRRVAGLRQVIRAAGQDRLERVFLAEDADERVKRQVTSACEAAGVPIDAAQSMELLAKACRIAVETAVAGLLKE